MESHVKTGQVILMAVLLLVGLALIGYALIAQDVTLRQDMEEYVDLAGQVQFPQPGPAESEGSENASDQDVTVEPMERYQNARDRDDKRSAPALAATNAPEPAQQPASQEQGSPMVIVITGAALAHDDQENTEEEGHPAQQTQPGDSNQQRDAKPAASARPKDESVDDHQGDRMQMDTPAGTASPEPVTTPEPTVTPAPTPRIGKTGVNLDACKAQNADFVGWLKIPGTKINYPVVWTDSVDYYLTHSFSGKESKVGTLFSLGKTDYKTPGKNIAIYGHHITTSGGNMFQPLMSYKKRSFYETHKTVYFDTLYGLGEYTIFAVVNLINGEWDPAAASFGNDNDFLAFVQRAKAQALYDTGVEVNADNHIITLITCDRSYHDKDGRLLVMAVAQ